MNAWEKQVTEQGLSMMTGKQRRERLENLMTNTVTGTAMRKRLILRSRARNKRRQHEANMINCNMQLGRMFMKNFVP